MSRSKQMFGKLVVVDCSLSSLYSLEIVNVIWLEYIYLVMRF